jgi:hypothetical protein
MTAAFPSSDVLRSLMTRVVETSCGLRFLPGGDEIAADLVPWRTAVLPILGGRAITVAISSDEKGCVTLASGLLQMTPAELDTGMVEDSLRELANMIAGQVKCAMDLDQALGLPKILSSDELENHRREGFHRVTVASENTRLVLWIWNGA